MPNMYCATHKKSMIQRPAALSAKLKTRINIVSMPIKMVNAPVTINGLVTVPP